MKLKDTTSGLKLDAIIERIDKKDFAIIKKSKRFQFNWDAFKGHDVYKISANGSTDILGIMCLINHTEPGFDSVEIKALEVGKENVGQNKKIDRIAGCLIAHACKLSIMYGHQGFVFLIPKTDLVKHYRSKYGFENAGISMASDDRNARKLIKRYLDD